MEIYKEFRFEAAHFLPNVAPDHKCREMHGHSYSVKVFVTGQPGKDSGWICDFKEIKDKISPMIDQLDHKMLNDVEGLNNPTAENITMWLWDKIQPLITGLSRIELKETATSGVIYEGH